jgi:hypothetical protein
MKKTSKVLSVMMIILFFVVSLSFVSLAAEKQTLPTVKKSQPEAQVMKIENVKIMQKTMRKIPSASLKANTSLPLNAAKVDLICSIKAYYDEARTMPVPSTGAQSGAYHLTPLQSPQRPLPYHVYFTIEVKNIGFKSAAANVTNRVFLTGNALNSPGNYVTSPAVTLEPGETAAYDYYCGPFGPNIALKDRVIMVQAYADSGSKVVEDSETNNGALYKLTFVWP